MGVLAWLGYLPVEPWAEYVPLNSWNFLASCCLVLSSCCPGMTLALTSGQQAGLLAYSVLS